MSIKGLITPEAEKQVSANTSRYESICMHHGWEIWVTVHDSVTGNQQLCKKLCQLYMNAQNMHKYLYTVDRKVPKPDNKSAKWDNRHIHPTTKC